MADSDRRVGEIDPVIRRNYEAYLAQPDEWKEQNEGKVVVFESEKLQGVFEDLSEALEFAVKKFRRFGDYLIHEVGKEKVVYHTRAPIFGME